MLQPIANTQQRTIFDSDFMAGQKNQEGEGNDDVIDGTYIDADVRPALPGPSDNEEPAEEQTEETRPAEEEGTDEPTEEQSGEPAEEEPEDITDDIMGDTDTEGYDYEDPEE